MDLLISPDLVNEFLALIYKDNRSQSEMLTYLTFQNKNNYFILSKKLLEFYEEEVKQFPEALEIFQGFFSEIINDRLINCFGCNNDNLLVVMQDIETAYLNDENLPKFSTVYLNISKTLIQSLNNTKSGILDNLIQNRHKLIFQLTAYNPKEVSFRYYDFRTNNEIKSFFDFLFNICTNYTEIDIFDRQINLQHNLYNSIKNIKKINYYTKKIYHLSCPQENRVLRSNFNRIKIFRIENNQIHERRIKIRNLIIEIDDDFWNLKVDRHTWKISILICDQTSAMIDQKKLLFDRCYS